MAKIVFVIGVSGSGKSTIGRLLARQLDVPFLDGDDFHPLVNIEKMKSGEPLSDSDRLPWLKSIHQSALLASQQDGAVIACSALKIKYRNMLTQDLSAPVTWTYLKGTPQLIADRMSNRRHFMPLQLLKSQYDILEEPQNAIVVDIRQEIDDIISHLMSILIP